MRTRPLGDALVLAAIALALLIGSDRQPGRAAATASPVSWQGLVGDGPRAGVDVGQQMIVLLKTRSVAERVAANGGVATAKQEKRWTSFVLSQQRLLISRLQVQGVRVRPEYSFARVVSGFSALLDATALSLVERDEAVQGVYPVRVAYPASTSSDALERNPLAAAVGNGGASLPGFDGRGITVALLDTGVDRLHPALLGSISQAIDVVDPDGEATPQAPPGRPTELERHGTELAEIVAGYRGPRAARGVAQGASVLPIRVAGWQPDGRGGYSVYARTDQLVEGLERAVDPNLDGDTHDAVRIALVGVAAPYAGFADDPAARAVAGATRLETLVVAPVGNDGPAGPGFGSVSGPGGAPAALTVGAADVRTQTQQVQVSLRSGLRVVLDRKLPLSGETGARSATTSAVTAPGLARPHVSFASLRSYFTESGLSLVAGRAALVPAGGSPAATARNAARAGATAVLLYGAPLPAGGVPLDEETPVPVVSIPAGAAAAILASVGAGRDAAVSIGAVRDADAEGGASVAPFSSTGLAYDGRVKPDIVASGVAVAAAEPTVLGDDSARYGTVNGSSAAAAAVAGAAAVLAEARPDLDAAALRSALVGTARRIDDASVESEGTGLVSLGAAAAAQLTTDATTLAFGNAHAGGWQEWQNVVVRNVSLRVLHVRVQIARYAQGAAAVRFGSVAPVTIPPRGERVVRIVAAVTTQVLGTAPAEGAVVLAPDGGRALRLPWVVTFARPSTNILGPLSLSNDSFEPSDTGPALLTFRAGRLVTANGRDAVQPVALLRLDLLRRNGSELGTLVTLRDLLPGRYAFGLTGRSSAGNVLGRGRYRIRVTAIPSLPGPSGVADVEFSVK